MLHLQTAALIAAAIHIPLALTVWSMLARRSNGLSLRLWVAGALAMGLGATLLAAENSVAAWASNHLANALLSAAPALRIAALRRDLGWSSRAGTLLLLCLLDYGGYLFTRHLGGDVRMMMVGLASIAAWTLAFAWHAMQAGRHLQSRSGWVLAGVEALFAAALLLRLAIIAGGWTEALAIGESWDFALLVAAGLLAALSGNLGYLGLVLDRTNAAAQQAREAERAEAIKREVAEETAAELRQLLAERDRLAAERERMLRLLAYEISQPLHNASGVLQAAITALEARDPVAAKALPADIAEAPVDEWLQRAQGVIGGVQSALDNTLALASLLRRESLPLLLDTDLDLLIELTLGDLKPEQRGRVQLRRRTSYRSVEVEPGLIRLALRNLLRNAFVHGGADVQVVLEIDELAAPEALVLRVSDNGPGVPEGLLRDAQAAQDRALSSASLNGHYESATSGERLGLFIVRRAAALHGGTLRLSAGTAGGLVASLVLPQPAEN